MLTVNQVVISTEHMKSRGIVLSVAANGDAKIQFITPPSSKLPYGHSIIEFWPTADQSALEVL